MKKRIGHYMVIVLAVIVSNFFIPRLLPGSPVRTLVGEDVADMSAEQKMGIMEAYHLNDPMYRQFGFYIRDLFTGNFGVSFSKRRPILDLLGSATLWTLLLSSVTMVFSVFFGCLLGALSALKRKKKRDITVVFGTTLISSIPPFWIAILLLAVFGSKLRLFPTYGAYSLWIPLEGPSLVLDVLWHLCLPAIVLIITSLMPYFSISRYSFLAILSEDYVVMAKMRGIPPRRINLFYIMGNTLIPVFSQLMMDVGYLLSGSVLIETVFSYPGLGVLMRYAVSARDYPLIQYTFLFSSFLTILALFIADSCYHRLNPTIREGTDEK
jgi:peptide/nickel transport system permease protein